MRRLSHERALLLIIVALGLALRVVPIWFGLPDVRARPDEEMTIGIARAILGGDPNPHFFNWPTLTMYCFAGVFAAASLVSHVAGLARALRPDEYYLLARGFVAIAGAATILVLWRLARRVSGAAVAIASAWFLAVAILHVRDSHFATTDVLMTLLVTASLAFFVGAAERDGATSARPWIVAGVLGGFATAAKYNAAVIVVAIPAALWRRVKDSRKPGASVSTWPAAVGSVMAFCAAFFAGAPFVLLDHHASRRDIAFESSHLRAGHGGIIVGRGWWYHLVRTLPYGLGIPVYLAAIAGVIVLARKRPSAATVLGAFAIAYYAAIGSGYTVFFRYAMPLVPLACFAAAAAAQQAAEWLAPRLDWSSARTMAVVCALLGAPSLVNAVWMDAILARTDTRHLASVWLQAHVASTESVGDAGGMYAKAPNLPGHVWIYDAATRSFNVPAGALPDWLVLYESPLRGYAQVPSELRSLASTRYELAYEARATDGAAGTAVYDMQDAFFLPISGFKSVERPGPTILVYRRAR